MTPMQLSYTQNLEDYHLSLAFAGQTTGTYIDVGAGHPIADNVSFWFYERGWRGIVVEPQPELAALYQRLRPRDLAVRGLVGRHCGEIDFHVVERLHGLSTTVESLAQKAKAFGVDWKRFRPKVIVTEAVTPMALEPAWQDWEPFLIAQGYRFVLFDTLNRFYVAQEHREIMARLPSERAPWHAVRHMNEIGRAPENKQHPDHALAQDLARGFWASLPYLDTSLITSLLSRARRIAKPDDIAALASTVDTEAFRAALGRVACGYDGGQIVDE